MIIERTGDIFESKAQILVCPVNIVGVMGAGLAKQFKQKYPDMEPWYKELCSGGLWFGQMPIWNKKVMLFVTKQHWKDLSTYSILLNGLERFKAVYGSGEFFATIAFPLLGAGLGGLDPRAVKEIMMFMLKNVNSAVEIWKQ